MKKLITIISISLCSGIGYAQEPARMDQNIHSVNLQAHESNFALLYGGVIEPHLANRYVVCPILLNSSLLWKEQFKLTLSGGYILSQHEKSPVMISEFGYEIHMKKTILEPYMKIERFLYHDPYMYYGTGMLYTINITKHFSPSLLVEYGKERNENVFKVGFKLPLTYKVSL